MAGKKNTWPEHPHEPEKVGATTVSKRRGQTLPYLWSQEPEKGMAPTKEEQPMREIGEKSLIGRLAKWAIGTK